MQVSKLVINSDDIEKMVSHPDRDVRAIVTQKICRTIRSTDLSEREHEIVRRILALAVKDAASMVRRALAITLKNSPNLPREIAQKLIRDVDSIATPILSHSPVLTDDDLLEILKSKAASKMMAVSKRAHISLGLVKAMIRYGDSHIVASLAANDGAEIDDKTGVHMLERYHDNDLVKDSFIARRELPTLLVEKLITLVSVEAARKLHENHEIPLDIAIKLAQDSRERAHVDFISQSWVSKDIGALVARLHDEQRLTNSLIVRAACCGQMRFCVTAMAKKAQVSAAKASLMVHDSGPFGLQALCTQAGLGRRDYAILRASVVIFKDLEMKNSICERQKFQSLMLERVLSLPLAFDEQDTDYLLERLDQIAA